MARLSSVAQAAPALMSGEVIAFPTETFFGLAGDPSNARAVTWLLEQKDRAVTAGIPLIIARPDVLDGWLSAEDPALRTAREALQEQFWPGPLTLVCAIDTSRCPLQREILGPGDSVAVRCSSNDLAQSLAASLSVGAITSTSANPKGLKPAETIEEVLQYFPEIGIVDAPLAPLSGESRRPSTILDVRKFPFTILREGAIAREPLERWLEVA